MNGLSKGSVAWIVADEGDEGQRIDNFLVRNLKGVPRSHVYRILRSGEVRVNSGRVTAGYRLAVGDRVRVPPVRTAVRKPAPAPIKAARLGNAPLFEDEWLLAVNKPAGVAVHGGSGVSAGVIERLRHERPQQKFLELVHRLDRETSGVLLLAKRRSALTRLHAQLRQGNVDKRYQALVLGKWSNKRQKVRLSLRKYVTESGERRVVVDEEGADAFTVFNLLGHYCLKSEISLPGDTGAVETPWNGEDLSLLEAELKTGRTHQIRVHLSYLGFPIAGDDKYGNFPSNKMLEKAGLKRMFLHAASMAFDHPGTGERVQVGAPLAAELADFLIQMTTENP